MSVLIPAFFLLTIVLIFHTHYAKTTRINLSSNRYPSFRLVHISDLHGKTLFLNGRISSLVNRLDPDLIFVTGDLANNRKQLDSVIREIGKMTAKHGIYFVPGNYEREEVVFFRKQKFSTEEYKDLITQLNQTMTVLENSGERLPIGEGQLFVYGFDNSVYGNERFNSTGSPIEYEHDFTILLAHSPNIISLVNELNLDYNLLLTGHTHGGQIRLFGRTTGSYKHFHMGVKKTGPNRFFAITRGLGTVKLPVRFACFPEICVYDITTER